MCAQATFYPLTLPHDKCKAELEYEEKRRVNWHLTTSSHWFKIAQNVSFCNILWVKQSYLNFSAKNQEVQFLAIYGTRHFLVICIHCDHAEVRKKPKTHFMLRLQSKEKWRFAVTYFCQKIGHPRNKVERGQKSVHLWNRAREHFSPRSKSPTVMGTSSRNESDHTKNCAWRKKWFLSCNLQ